MKTEEYEAAAEAILFAMGDSVEAKQIADALGISEKEAHLIIKNLQDRYKGPESGIEITVVDGAYQMRTKKEQYESLIKVVKQSKRHSLTDVQLETLSIIAYRQPVTRLEIEKIRGVSCDHAVNKLIEYGLIEEKGRLDAPGRPIIFGTTRDFLRCFGVSSPEDLPDMDPERRREIAKMAKMEMGISPEDEDQMPEA